MLDYFSRRKELQAMEARAIEEGRLPPGQSLTVKWPVLHAGSIPQFDPDTWRFRIFGLVDSARTLTWDQFSALPRESAQSDIHCVTRWSKLDNEWEGVPARDVLASVRLDPRATHVLVHAPEYSANLPIGALFAQSVLFATRHNGTELSPEHGHPVRLVVPDRYFWKSVKWVNGLEFLDHDEPGFWETRGYHNVGDPFAEERFS